jgi:predicted secreted hydrolase
MAIRTATLLLILALCLSSASIAGCGGEEEESSPYGPPQVHFPEDEGAHPDAGVEWWYLNALVEDAEGHEYGAMVAYFNPGLKIISLSDLEGGHYLPEVAFDIPDFAEGRLDLRWGDDDRWHRTDDDPLSYSLKAFGSIPSFDLNLTAEKPPLLVGGDGFIEWTDGGTYYYSLTRLAVEGEIRLSGREFAVEGIGWMDHQWMESIGDPQWDWFSVQLDDGSDLIFWRVIAPDGSVSSRDLTVMFADSTVYNTVDLGLEQLDTWVSPETGNEYGTLWRLTEETHGIDLQIEALYPEQEVRVFEDFEGMDFDFWEGATTVSGTFQGEPASGIGYMELVLPPTGVLEDEPNPWE